MVRVIYQNCKNRCLTLAFISGVDFGQINVALDAPDESGKWILENVDILLENPDDVIYYWYYVVVDNNGHQVTEQ